MAEDGAATATEEERRVIALHLKELQDKIALSLKRDEFNSANVHLYGLDEFWSALQEPASMLIKEQRRLKLKLLKRDLADELTRIVAPNPEVTSRALGWCDVAQVPVRSLQVSHNQRGQTSLTRLSTP
jgi:hypothetical protein